MKKRPHIIIFNPDEMRADSLHHLGNEASITPELDRFQKEDAVSFRNAYCQNPVCVPSRCSFMTGLYPHTKGHRTMQYLLRPGEDSLLKELHDNGYYVWMNDRNDLTAGQYDNWTESMADEIYYTKQIGRPLGPINYVRGNIGDKNYYTHYKGQLEVDKDGINYNADDQAIDAAINRIKNYDGDKPLCMFLGLLYPHVPYNVEELYFSAIDRKKLKPRIKFEDTSLKAPILEAIKNNASLDKYSEQDWDKLRSTYLGMCMKVDYQFKKICDALKEKGIYDDCAIFFFSDHGDFTGDYTLVEKCQNSFEDCLTNVPFLVKAPKGYEMDPGISNSLVELVDFYATALDFANVKSTHTHFGKSLVDVLKDRSMKVRDYVCSEGGREYGEIHCDEFHAAGPNGPSPTNDYYPKMLAEKDDLLHDKGIMIRDLNYKYISRSNTLDELYDLKNDPNELHNVISDKQYINVVTEYRYKLLKWLQHTDSIVPFDYDQRFTKEMMWAKVCSMVKKEHEAEVKKLINEGIAFNALISYCVKLLKEE